MYNTAPTSVGSPSRVRLSTSCAPQQSNHVSVMAGLVAAGTAFVFFLLLSQLLLVYPGTFVAAHNDVIFGTDIADRWKELSGETSVPASLSHLMLTSLWGNIGKGLARMVEL